MKIQWNKVTWYSKLVAVIVYVLTFVLAFKLGMLYEAKMVVTNDWGSYPHGMMHDGWQW